MRFMEKSKLPYSGKHGSEITSLSARNHVLFLVVAGRIQKDAKYMSGRQGIHLLVDIVAKGGNLLLNVAPTPEGEWQQGAYNLLKEYGAWLKINGEGIYHSKVLEPFKENNICMTQQDNGNKYFFIYVAKMETIMPKEIIIVSHQPATNAVVSDARYQESLKMAKA
ncbi:MAG: alpha-L-fucosidase [Marinilabiliales bacterium]|nr:alpha-L-fucosidase [Marinilabiliales bacterium]